MPDGLPRDEENVREPPGRDGRWLVLVEERATGNLDRLVAELRHPSDPRSDKPCPAMLRIVPYFALVDAAGKAIAPSVPTDGCAQPRQSALDALEALPFRTVATTPIRQVESAGAVATGCAQEWKDVIAIQIRRPSPGPARPMWDRPSRG